MIRRNGKMTLTLNKKKYLNLLDSIEIIPKIIETEVEYNKYLAVVEKLIFLKNKRTSEETALFRLLVKLIEDYEEEIYDLENWSNLKPHEILVHLLESSGKDANDLIEVLNFSKEQISSITNGKKFINKEQAQKLGIYFKVSPSLFFE